MKKNHFIFGYAGNKRREVDDIVQNTPLNNVTTIVEPYCGTSALSCYLSILHPNRFVYHLNDNDSKLIELYEILKDPIKTKQLEDDYNECIKDMTKEKYHSIIDSGAMLGYILARKHYYMRVGAYSTTRQPTKGSFINSIIVKFLQTENVKITNIDGESVMKDYISQSDTIIYLDPPYLKTSNKAYYNNCSNLFSIYKYLETDDIKNYKSKIYLHVLKNPNLYDKIKNSFGLIYYKQKHYGWHNHNGKTRDPVIHELFRNREEGILFL